jgi:hypothetical protein
MPLPRRFVQRLAATVGLALMFAAAGAPARAAFVDGKRYLSMSDDQRTMYMAGLADMMARMVGVSVPDEMKRQTRYERCLYNMTDIQVRQFMDAYMREDPSTTQYNMATNFRAALNVACPSFPDRR